MQGALPTCPGAGASGPEPPILSSACRVGSKAPKVTSVAVVCLSLIREHHPVTCPRPQGPRVGWSLCAPRAPPCQRVSLPDVSLLLCTMPPAPQPSIKCCPHPIQDASLGGRLLTTFMCPLSRQIAVQHSFTPGPSCARPGVPVQPSHGHRCFGAPVSLSLLARCRP